MGDGVVPEAMALEERERARTLLEECRSTSRRLGRGDEVLLARLVLDGRWAEAHAAAADDPTEAAAMRTRVADGRAAAMQLELYCLPLVAHVARRYRGRGVDVEDLVQEGWFGIRRAIELWDYRKGFRLGTYAAWWARQAVQRAVVRQGRLIRLPRPVVRQVDDVVVAQDALLLQSGAAPLPAIAQRTGVALEEVGTLLQLARPPVPLEPVAGQGGRALEWLVPAAVDIAVDGGVEHAELAAALGQALDRLGQREREVVQRRFGVGSGDGDTLERIGADVGVTRERVRQIESTALQKLRQNRELQSFWLAG